MTVKTSGVTTITVDMIREAIWKRFGPIADVVDTETLHDLATKASQYISNSVSEAIDMVVMEWAREVVD